MSNSSVILDRAIAPLDGLRRGLLLALQRSPTLGRIVARRDDRVLVHTLVGVTAAFVLAVLCPAVLFVLGPALFGVAHIASDVRYLVLRRGLPRGFIVVTVGACGALLLLRVIEAIAPGRLPFPLLEVALGWGFALFGLAAGSWNGGTFRRASWLGPFIAGCTLAAVTHPVLARIVFAHAHNLVALVLWAALFRRRVRFALPVLGVSIACALVLSSGATIASTHFGGAWGERMVGEMIFGWPGWVAQRTALGLGLSYVFLQTLHYSAWLSWIPQEDIRSEGTLSFRMSARGLVNDFGRLPFVLIAVAVLAVLGASFIDVHRTRHLYLSLASFHGYLELAAGAFLLTSRDPRSTRSSASGAPSAALAVARPERA